MARRTDKPVDTPAETLPDPTAAAEPSEPASETASVRAAPEEAPADAHRRGWRRWAFPLLTAVLVPLLVLGGLELGLRLIGYGFTARFWVPVTGLPADAEPAWTTNPRYGWRFFPPAIARSPAVAKIPLHPSDDTLRLVVLGGSAALGTPDPAYGFSRMLDVMLRETWPERRTEVVNAAMTAINSHVVLPIGEESLRRLHPDALLVYVGNNEVVGPYGPGTVFAGFSDNLAAIRWSRRLAALRIGQLIRNLAGSGDAHLAEWRGLEMFEDRTLREDDPRLGAVYAHLEANLRDLAAAARSRGVPVLLSTVAVNLTDCPPFASVHRQDLGDDRLETFQQAFDRGVQRLGAAKSPDDVRQAMAAFDQAEEIDDGWAKLHFYRAHAHKLLQETDEAEKSWKRARDTDALRFRADSRINQVIREVAGSEDGVELIDGEAAVAGDGGPPGNDLFWEHVHLNPEGNYRLAEAFFDRIARMSGLTGAQDRKEDGMSDGGTSGDDTPDATEPGKASAPGESPPEKSPGEVTFGGMSITGGAASKGGAPGAGSTAAASGETGVPQPPSRERVMERLALTPWDRHRLVATVLSMTARPPFTAQIGHREVQQQRALQAAEMELAAEVGIGDSETMYRQALDTRPDDLLMRANFAGLLQEAGKRSEAIAQWDDLLSRVPGVVSWRTRRAFAVADLATRARAQQETPQSPQAPQGSGMPSEGTGSPATPPQPPPTASPEPSPEQADAVAEMEALRDHNRRSPEAWLNLGSVLEEVGLEDRAEQTYRETLERFPSYQPALLNLGTLLADEGELDAAAQLYRDALARTPEDSTATAELHGRLGEVLDRKEDADGALDEYRKALDVDPDLATVRNNLGFLLERQGKANEAAQAYQQAIDSDPAFALPYFNLGDLLLRNGRAAQAAQIYRSGLALSPFNLQGTYNLGVALAAAGRQADAAETFRRLLQVAPDHPGALNNLAWLLATSSSPEVRDPDRAVELARKALEKMPGNPQVYETLARAYAAAGRRREARETAAKALEAARASGNDDLLQALTRRLKDLG